MPEVLHWIYSSRRWELDWERFIGVFLLPAFKRKAEMIHPDTSAELLYFRATENTWKLYDLASKNDMFWLSVLLRSRKLLSVNICIGLNEGWF